MAVDNDEQLSSAIGVILRGHADIGKSIVGWEDVPTSSKDFCYARLGVSNVYVSLLISETTFSSFSLHNSDWICIAFGTVHSDCTSHKY